MHIDIDTPEGYLARTVRLCRVMAKMSSPDELAEKVSMNRELVKALERGQLSKLTIHDALCIVYGLSLNDEGFQDMNTLICRCASFFKRPEQSFLPLGVPSTEHSPLWLGD